MRSFVGLSVFVAQNHLGGSINEDTPIAGWFTMEHLIKIDDFGVPPFQETSIIQQFSKFALVFPSGRITPTFSPPFSGLQPISVRLHPHAPAGFGTTVRRFPDCTSWQSGWGALSACWWVDDGTVTLEESLGGCLLQMSASHGDSDKHKLHRVHRFYPPVN